MREIDYIPEWSYLQQNKFDISNPENMDVKENFRGRKIVKDWGNKTLVLLRIHNGKVTGRGIPKSNTLNRTETCSTIRYCIWQQDCELEFVGDVVSLDCSEWYNTHECWDETVCTGGVDDCEEYGINCDEPGDGDGPTPIPLVIIDTVINDITDPCIQNAFAEITADNKLKNEISKLYQETFVGNNNTHNLWIHQVPTTVNNYPGQSHPLPGDPNTWEIQLNFGYAHQFTQELWGSIILHEIVHSFIQKNNLDFGPTSQFTSAHLDMLNDWILQIQSSLIESFGMDPINALALSLQGFDEILTIDGVSAPFKQSWIDNIQNLYSINLNQADSIQNLYINKQLGTPCP